MSPRIALVFWVLVIAGLFFLDRDRKARTSASLWIPVIWIWLAGSRSVAEWVSLGPPATDADQYLEGSPLNRLVYSGLLLCGFIILANRRRQIGRLLRANGPVLVFFLYSAMSIAWSDYPDVAFKRWHKALGDFVMILIVLSDREPFVAVKRLLARVTYILIPVSVLFIKYYPDLGRTYGKWDWKVSYTGVTTNKNTLGVICLLGGLASLWRFLSAWQDRRAARRRLQLIAHSAVLVMILWLFWVTNSMTSLACFLMAGGLLFATHVRAIARTSPILHMLVAVILLVSFSVLFLGAGPGLLNAMGRDPTLTDRTAIWDLVISLSPSALIGTGFESFWLGQRLARIWTEYSWGPTEAHNGYIEIYLNLGWVGIALLAVILVTGYRTVFAAVRRGLPTSSLMLAYFVVGLIYNFTEAAFFRMMAPAWIYFLLALTRVPERSLAKTGRPVPASPDRAPARPALALHPAV